MNRIFKATITIFAAFASALALLGSCSTSAPDSTTTTTESTTTAPETTTTELPTTTSTIPEPEIPSGAIVVAVGGSDTAAGTIAAPLRTVTQAVSKAASGGVIVLRQGVYHEAFKTPANKALKIQAYPGETVWFDGSEVMSDFVKDGSTWRMDGWNVDFDNSPTYKRGAADNTEMDWTFVNPAYPMAAHPDQVWVDGAVQRQVGSIAQVVPGTFYEDSYTKKLYLGSDPTGHEVRASTLGRAVLAQGPDTSITGISFRRFSPSVPDMGAVVFTGPRAAIADSTITEMATTGLAIINADSSAHNVEVSYSGMLGIHADAADRLVMDGVNSHHNNTERFNMAPVAGGFKTGRMRGLTIRNSTFSDNYGTGFWADESVYDITLVNNNIKNNAGHGISLELSAKALVANNVISGSGNNGIKVNNTSEVEIVNNTFIGNGRSINIVQDPRTPENTSYGHNPARPKPDPTMPWVIGPVLVQGNIIAHQRTGNCMLCVEDYSERFTAEQLRVNSLGNLYSQPYAGSVQYFIVWSRGAGNPAVYPTVDSFRSATGQEAYGRHIIGPAPTDDDGKSTGVDLSGAPAIPTDILSISQLPDNWNLFGANR